MGYYTNYEITIDKHNSEIDVQSDDFVEIVVSRLNELSDYGFDEDLSQYSIKWYDWEDHMRQLSSEFPSVLFTVNGVGEEDGDIWRAYFTNGKCQLEQAIVAFPPFDESKLD